MIFVFAVDAKMSSAMILVQVVVWNNHISDGSFGVSICDLKHQDMYNGIRKRYPAHHFSANDVLDVEKEIVALMCIPSRMPFVAIILHYSLSGSKYLKNNNNLFP